MESGKGNLMDLLRQVLEMAMPNIRHYYRNTRKAKVVATYPAGGGHYYADVKPLRNDESEDEREPVVPKVEIPTLWGGGGRGLVCPPEVGALCDLSYYDGDPNYPRISNFRGMNPPDAKPGECVLQLEPGVEIRIDKDKQVVTLTSSNWKVNVAGSAEIKAAGGIQLQGEVEINGNASINGMLSVSNGINGKVIGCSGC